MEDISFEFISSFYIFIVFRNQNIYDLGKLSHKYKLYVVYG